MKRILSLPLPAQILIAMLLGGLAGSLLGSQVAPLGALGKLVIQLIKALAVPLVFFAIVEAILSTHIPSRSALSLIFITAINACFAATIGLCISNLIQPGRGLEFLTLAKGISNDSIKPFAQRKLEFSEILAGYIPENFLQPFHDNNIISVVLLAILVGAAGRVISKRETHFNPLPFTTFFVKLFEQILLWLVRLVPLAVFGVMCKTVGEYGFAPFRNLALYVTAGFVGMLLHVLIVYQAWIALYAKIPLGRFWHTAKGPLVYAFGTNSSLATLPLTLNALDAIGTSKGSSRLGACIGTNLNNDGILLYEAMAVLFICQAHGIELSLAQQISTALLCVLAAIGVAGVPEAGVISLSLVLTTVGLPLELLPLLLTVDWLVARARSVTNVLADMTVSIAIERMQHPFISTPSPDHR